MSRLIPSRGTAGARGPGYKEGPLLYVLLAVTFALAGYAGVRWLADDWFGVAVWFVGCALVHDLVLLPLYSAADLALRRVLGPRQDLVNFVRVPALLSVLLLVMWFPLIARPERYEPYTGLSPDVFLGNWLLITAALFAVSALWLGRRAVRVRRLRRSETKGRPSASH